jgi:glycerate 2-kinase
MTGSSDETSNRSTPHRRLLRDMFQLAVDRAHPAVSLPAHLPDVPDGGRIIVVGAGKANAAMAIATERHYANAGLLDSVSGFVTTRHGFHLTSEHIGILEAAHPTPDPNSLLAARWTLQEVATAGPRDLVLVLMSGGASALWSAPVEGVTLADKKRLTRQLLASGATISEINTIRRHISRIKGGRLAQAAVATGARLITLAISDVPGDHPAAIGSGPTVGDPTTLADARGVLERYRIEPPPAIARALANAANETIKPADPLFDRTTFQIIAAPKASLEAVAASAAANGYQPVMLGDALEGEARDLGRAHAALAIAAKRRGDKVAILSGGELTVTVTGRGSGGPNQEYALGLAIGLDGTPGISALACDTDGIDGGGGDASDPAGAMVFPDTLARSRSRHIDAAAMLSNNDSTGFFRSIEDLVACGPTQTNVNDCRIILVDP